MKCCQCSRRIRVGSMCEECLKRNQQGDGWRLKARRYNHRQYPPPYGVLTKGGNRLKLAIKAAKIRMPWQTVRAVKGWITDTGFGRAYWIYPEDSISATAR